jgi:hypothetical protein
MTTILNMNAPRQEQQDPLNLRSLPLVPPGRDGWPEVRDALLDRGRARKRQRAVGGGLAAAAMAVLTLALLFGRPGHDAALPGPEQPAAETAAVQRPLESEPVPLQDPPVESLIAMSQQLENRLRTYRRQLGDLPAGVLVYQVELQDLIVQVDEQLSRNPGSINLWGQRVNLLLDVNRLYENQLRRDYHRMASL